MGPPLPALFDLLPNAFMVLDRELRYVTANPAYLRITGSALSDLQGRHVFDVFPDDSNAAMLRHSFERVLASGEPDEVPAIRYRVPRTPGGPDEERVWSAKHTPIPDQEGRVEYIIQETSDVTHLEGQRSPSVLATTVLDRALNAQTAVTKLDEQLRVLHQMFAQTPGFIAFMRGPDHVFTLANAAYSQMVGHRNVVGMPIRDALPEVVEQGFVGILDRVYATGEPYLGREVPVMLQRTPGAGPELCFADFIFQPIRDEAGNVAGIFVQGQDVTGQQTAQLARDAADAATREAERLRAQAETRLRFLIELLPVQVWTSKPDGQLDFVSSRVVEYFQRPAEHILGAGWQDVIHPDDLGGVATRWGSALETGDPYEVEFRLRRGDGDYRWHLGRATAERDASGVIIGWIGSNTDIDDARRAIAELEARSQYEQRLIGIVSHDLRNPLNAIALGSHALEATVDDPRARKLIAAISRASERATRLIRDLLDFARQRGGGSIPVNRRPTNLREVIEQVVDELKVAAPDRVICIEHSGEENGTWDMDRIAQVISNLVGNALQHGSRTEPVLVTSRIDQATAVLEVTNRGTVIPPQDLATLFDPFSRGRHAGHVAGSLGLGLYIAREVVIAHGGHIQVASQDELGTRFTVQLPRYP